VTNPFTVTFAVAFFSHCNFALFILVDWRSVLYIDKKNLNTCQKRRVFYIREQNKQIQPDTAVPVHRGENYYVYKGVLLCIETLFKGLHVK